jgi:hypothetical protein
MFRFSPMKFVVVLMWTLRATFTAASDQILLLDPLDHPGGGQIRELLHSARQLQDVACLIKTSTALTAAEIKLSDQYFAAIDKCRLESPNQCSVNWAALSGYNNYKNTCSTAKGAFSTYKVTISCSDGSAVVLSNYPFCLVSATVNKKCGPKQVVADIEGNTFGQCTNTATNTGYTDYSVSKPVKKPVKKPVMKPAKKPVMRPVRRRFLAMEESGTSE